ncbi:MAG: hypothetical protein IKW85_01315 [Muribaculaceae bacterium]|nr:hypothetical protein [Muribaculaceae bacterium]
MAFPFHSSGSVKEVDFNFPQDVSKDALSDLKEAMKSGNGQLTVDALVRYSIAQSGISQDNMPDIIEQLEKVIKAEKQPHIRALLNYFEATIYQAYGESYAYYRDRENPVEETPTDVSEWSREQFEEKIAQLIAKSLEDPEALKRVPVTSMPDILIYNDLGATYIPTLLEFLSMQGLEVMSDISTSHSLFKQIRDRWLMTTEDNVPAHIYAMTKTGKYITAELYKEYQDNEYSALLLNQLSSHDDETYQLMKDYVKRFPKSIFTPEMLNRITDAEVKYVSISYPETRSTHDSIEVKMTVKNTNSFNIALYRVVTELRFDEYLNDDTVRYELVEKYPVKVKGTIPFEDYNVKLMLPPLPYGIYVMKAIDLTDKNAKGVSRESISVREILRITDMAMISINRLDDKDKVGTVDLKTGKPIAGATVKYYNRKTQEAKVTGIMGTTNAQGLIDVPKNYTNNLKGTKHPFNSMTLWPTKGEDKYANMMSYSRLDSYDAHRQTCNIYTDLGVYRPGETVQWAIVAFDLTGQNRVPLADKEIQVSFFDYNYKIVDEVKAKTDAYGRAEGSFVVPKDRMNGYFFLEVNYIDNSRTITLGRYTVNVSEYKMPTFTLTFPDVRDNFVTGQPVKISGKVETYSGMPVASTEVRLSLIQSQWDFWSRRYASKLNGDHLMDTTVTTDAQGMFTFSYEPGLFIENTSGKGWSHNNYQVVATVTNDAGETQEESFSFIIGKRRGIELGIINDNVFLNDKPITLPLKYNTTDELHPNTFCTWEVAPYGSNDPVKTGNLNTADPTIDLTDLPSGVYKLTVRILDAEEGEEDVSATGHITLFRKTDKEPPVKDEPLWISPLTGDVDKTNTGHITVGVAVPRAYIYYVAATTDEVVAEGWLDYNKGLHDFTVPLPKKAGADVTVQFVTFYETKCYRRHKKLENPYKAEALNISATSFRDKLAPGDIEHWTFTLTDQNGKPMRGAMLLDMYDKAIASIAGNDWSWHNWIKRDLAATLNFQSVTGSNNSSAAWMGNKLQIDDRAEALIPYLNTYDNSPFSRRMRDYMLGGGPVRMMKNEVALAEESSYATKEFALSAAPSDEEDAKVNEKNLEKVVLRENDVKTALWQPLLTSDDKGVINLEFEVPNFNTTWNTQALAWNEKTVGSSWMAEVLTQKPLMVKASMPRFLRQGDKTQLAATVQNATDQAAKCDAVIELFDPRSGDIFATRKFNLELDGKGSQAVKIDWTVPDTISFVGFRIKAANGRYGDGEQVMVPVLTTISPVIETEPFYIEAAQAHYETTLPQFPKDARVTLEYCDNPVWYCVLALPTIFSDSYCTATQAAHSLFALEVAQSVAKSQPQIKEAVNYWKEHNEDSTLVSMLEKNQDLKIGTLLASPWVRDADRQTLRMSRLHELFDDNISNQEYEKILAALQLLQMPDGGFTWFRCPDCESSLWTTGTVLELIGEIKRLGGLPDDSRLTSMIDRAIKYYDEATMKEYNKIKKETSNPEAAFNDYAYTRSLFSEQPMPKDNTKLLKKIVKYMDKSWKKGLTLSEKAWYAMTLNRNRKQKTASNIIESIRQFAIVKPSTGMYWDNLQTGRGWWEYDKVAYTSTILRAMSEIDPRQDEIDQVRKWMLLMKQTNDWGSYSLAADAVYSILSTGSQWLERNALPSITVAGQAVSLYKMAEWLGYFRTTLDATTTGNVVIDRTGSGPAWGAIYSQYKAPMTQVQEKAIEEVSISKEYYVYAQDGTLHQTTSFKVGDKVKVRVVIKVNKDMDYVTVTDERAACFEPVDKLSGYRSADRTWYYLETKDTQTNMFFNSLSKGTHVVGYEVWVTNPGEFTSGIATIQSQYAPQMSAHSAGKMIAVDQKE